MGYKLWKWALIIMRLLIILILTTAVVHSCGVKNQPLNNVVIEKDTIAILPFRRIDKLMSEGLRDSLQQRLAATIILLPPQSLPAEAFYEKRQRYIADSLLVWLKEKNKGRYAKMIGVTASDIGTRHSEAENWGVMGLANCPGEACIISSFRVKRYTSGQQHLMRRMMVLALHEIGHTYSLPHCNNNPCLMRDAEGKMNLDNGTYFCHACTKTLKKQGLLSSKEL
jgi:archaemetzincin